MKKRILALISALLFVISLCFVSCTEQTTEAPDVGETTVGPEETEGEEVVKDDLPEITFTDPNYTFRIIGQGGSGWTANNLLYPEEESEDPLTAAKLLRYSTVEERFQLANKIEVTLSDTVLQTVQSAIRSGSKDFDLIAMDTYATFSAATSELLVDLYSLDYLDLSKPYYDQNYIHDMAVDGRLFSVVSDMEYIDMYCMFILMYNKKILKNLDLTDPYDHVQNNTWTLDTFKEMLKNVSQDDGDGVWNEKDTYGFACHTGSARSLYFGSGLSICTMNDSTKLPELTIVNADKEKLVNVAEKIRGIIHEDNTTLLNTGIVNAFMDGRVLFLSEIVGYLGAFREMKDDFGVVPFPKYDESQDRYYMINDPCIMVMSIPNFNQSQTELDRTSIIFEALSSTSYNTVRPAYYEDVLSGKETRDYQSYEMLNLCRESRIYDFGYFNNIGTISTIFSDLAADSSPDIVSRINRGAKSANKQIDKIIRKYQEIGE